MDAAVGLVQAYLHVNGYFTVVEYPVLEAGRAGQVRTVTDLDILAYRFAGAGHDIVTSRGHRPLTPAALGVDRMLGCASDQPDMIVGEVKEGRARLNAPLLDPAVLEVALTRFGCCPAEYAPELSRQLLSRGQAKTPAGHAIRMVAFGDSGPAVGQGPWTTVPMGHVVQYLQQYLHQHWPVLRHAQVRDPAFAVLALLEKWGVQPGAGARPGRREEDSDGPV